MALTVPCPKCATKLLAPDSAVGRQLRCPKCGTLATVPDLLPAEEVPVVEAAVVKPPPKSTAPKAAPAPPPPPKPKPIMAEDPTVDRSQRETRRAGEDEDEDRPRKKKKRPRYVDDDDDYDHDHPRRRRRKSGNGAVVAALVIGGMLLLAGVGFAVYLFAGKNSPLVKRTPVPAGWEQHSYSQDGLKLYLPKAPNHTSMPLDGFRPGAGAGRGRPRFGMGGFEIADDLPEADRFAQLSAGDWRDPVQIEVWVIKFRDRVPASIREQIRRYSADGRFGGVELRTVKWLGHDALEQVHTNGVLRIVYTDRHFVMASIHGPSGGRAKPEEEAGFFDNFELTN
jgi:hypothetical protein